MNSRVAILDLGTNTFHLLIADINEGIPTLIHQETIAVRLGEGGISQAKISPKAFRRGLNAIRTFKKRIDLFQPAIIKSAATSAIRSAENGNDFIEKIRIITGLHIETIDGEREAELIYTGVKAAVKLSEKSLIVDIGGGSVEFIICDHSRVFWKESYAIGAARLMDEFHHADPIHYKEINAINQYLHEELDDLQQQLDYHHPQHLVGSAGAFETFAELQNTKLRPSFENAEHAIDLQGFMDVYKMIINSDHDERSRMAQIPPVRVDMIVVAAIVTKYILDMCEFKSLKVSYYSLKEGLLFELLE